MNIFKNKDRHGDVLPFNEMPRNDLPGNDPFRKEPPRAEPPRYEPPMREPHGNAMTVDASSLYLPVHSTFNGDIITDGNARVDGVINGNFTSENGNVILGSQSCVSGDVFGFNVDTYGSINGNITAIGKLSIFSGARIVGNVEADSFVVEKDAEFEGRVKICRGDAIVMPNRNDEYAEEADGFNDFEEDMDFKGVDEVIAAKGKKEIEELYEAPDELDEVDEIE